MQTTLNEPSTELNSNGSTISTFTESIGHIFSNDNSAHLDRWLKYLVTCLPILISYENFILVEITHHSQNQRFTQNISLLTGYTSKVFH